MIVLRFTRSAGGCPRHADVGGGKGANVRLPYSLIVLEVFVDKQQHLGTLRRQLRALVTVHGARCTTQPLIRDRWGAGGADNYQRWETVAVRGYCTACSVHHANRQCRSASRDTAPLHWRPFDRWREVCSSPACHCDVGLYAGLSRTEPKPKPRFLAQNRTETDRL